MPTIKLEIVTAERQVFSGDVTTIIAEGSEGQMTVLPKHAPLITMLAPGELVIRKDGDEQYMVISGGFMEVMPDKVIVLADACERSDEIDLERATAAKQRAEERLKSSPRPIASLAMTPGTDTHCPRAVFGLTWRTTTMPQPISPRSELRSGLAR